MRVRRIVRRALAGVRHPRRVYDAIVRRATYLWGPRFASWLRKRWVILKNPHAEIRFGKYCLLGPGFSLHMPDGGRFIAGKAVDFRRGFRAEISNGATVRIGDVCVFSYYSLIQCSTSIVIGDRAMFGQSSIVVDGNHQLKDVSKPIHGQGFEFRPIKIADDVTTLTKVTIVNDLGTKSIVAANSVVNRPVPPYCMVGGVPARLIDYFGPPEHEPAEWRERRRARGEPEPTPRPNRLEVSGHSISFGGGVSAFEHRFTTRLAELLDAEEVNRSVGGAIACWHETGADPGDGGYARALQRFRRPADAAATHPEGLVCLAYFGINDLAVLGPHNLGPFEHALRTVISRHRASAVFEESHESVSYTAGWRPREPQGPDCSGMGVIETSTAGETLTISVPEAFPGGTVAVGFVAASDGGALHAFEIDGEDAGTLDTRGITEPLGHRNGAVMRLIDLSRGAHAISCRIREIAGPTAFDYWQIEPEEASPVLVPLAYPMLDWGFYETWPHSPTAANVEALNESISSVAAEFGKGVIPVDTESTLRGDRQLFDWRGAYPNDEGHARLARACHQALDQARARDQKTGVSV